MYRRTAHRGIAALTLVLLLTLVGAQPAAAANRGSMQRFAGVWEAILDTVPGAHAALDTLTGWFHLTENATSSSPDPAGSERGWGIDPNGVYVVHPAEPVPPGTQN
ncbi:MAG: hypothetical protein JF614_06520 [Acidobacteria bacterium]|nr:hypothetical protein [Acidobacteriota bacterium]